MARTPEGVVKDQCLAVLKTYGAYHFFPVTSGYGRSGVPDIVACYRGIFIGVECKAGAKKPTALQESEMRKIEAAGGHTLVVREDTVQLLIQLLENLR
jgi:Holliday junction resolvase